MSPRRPPPARCPADITTPAAKPRLTAVAEAAILAKRMSEGLTGDFLTSPRLRGEAGFARWRESGWGASAFVIFGICGGSPSPQPSPLGERGEGAAGARANSHHVPPGLTRRGGIAFAGSSGQGCLG